MIKLARPVVTVYHDGRRSKHQINYCVQLPIKFGNKQTNAYYFVARTDSRWPVTLGLPWFNRYIPELERALAIFFNSQPERIHYVDDYADEILASYAQVNEVLMVGGVTSNPTDQLPKEFLDDADIFNEKDLPSLKEPLKPYFRINVKDEDLPPPAKNIPRSPKQLEEEDRWLKQYLADGKIRESFSKTAAASFFVNKQCTGCHQLRCSCGKYDYPQRMVLDMRLLNAKEKQDPYPLPNIAEVMLQAAGHKFYFKGDIVAAFENLGVHPDDRHKTAFVCSRGIYEWLVMSFGYINAPAHWQRYIDTILLPVREFCRAYMDDLVVWADTYEEYVSRVKQVLQILRQAKLRLKLRKCEFFKHEISYLGHILGEHGTRMDPEKVKALQQWPDPETKKDLKGFAAFASYYRNYIKNLAEALIPIYEGIKDHAPNIKVGTPEIMQSFQRVKNLFVKKVQLTPYDPTALTKIHTDSSSTAWGGDISQNGKPLAFISGKFKDTERSWGTTDRELYPVVKIHEKFHYLLQGNVIWITDHKANEAARTTLANSPRRIHWRETLDRFPFRVQYKRGKEMHIDGMTRHSTYPQDNGFGGTEPIIDPSRWTQNEEISSNKNTRSTSKNANSLSTGKNKINPALNPVSTATNTPAASSLNEPFPASIGRNTLSADTSAPNVSLTAISGQKRKLEPSNASMTAAQRLLRRTNHTVFTDFLELASEFGMSHALLSLKKIFHLYTRDQKCLGFSPKRFSIGQENIFK